MLMTDLRAANMFIQVLQRLAGIRLTLVFTGKGRGDTCTIPPAYNAQGKSVD